MHHDHTARDLDLKIEVLDLSEDITPDLLKELSIHILQKSKSVRTQKELDILELYTSGIEFFKRLREENDKGSEMHIELCRSLEYEDLESNKVLFAAGSIGTKFYIILEGKVDVEINILTKDLLGNEHFVSKKVGEMGPGKSFGELAIMEDSLKPRKATIISREYCRFATLTRNDFRHTLGHIKREQEAQIELFSSNPVFHKSIWSNRGINLLIRSFQPFNNVRRNTFIYKEGDSSDNIYFIMSGEVVATKTVVIPNPDNFQKDVIIDDEDKLYQINREPFVKKMEICYFRQGQIFGEEETLEAYMQDSMIEKEKDRLKREIKKQFEEERKRKAREGFRFKPNGIIKLPYFETEDPQSINEHAEAQLKGMFPRVFQRITNIMVTSSKADMLVLDRKNFYAQIMSNPKAFHALKETLRSKRQRREDRIKDVQRSSANNLEFISKHTVSILNSDIKSLVYKKKAEKQKKTIELLTEDKNELIESALDSMKFISQTREVRYQYEKIPKLEGPLPTPRLFTMYDKFSKKNTLLPGVADRLKKMLKGAEHLSSSPDRDKQSDVHKKSERSVSFNNTPGVSLQRRDSQETSGKLSQLKNKGHYLTPQRQLGSQRSDISPNTSVQSIRGSSVSNFYIDGSFIKRAKEEKMKKYRDKKELLHIRNPTVGMTYLTNLDHHEQIKRQQILNSDNRISSKPRSNEIMDPEEFSKKRFETKNKVMHDLKRGKIQDPRFFTIKELKESQKETSQQLKEMSRPGFSASPEVRTSRSLPHSPLSSYRNLSPNISPRSPRSPRSPTTPMEEVATFQPYLPKGYRSHIIESQSTNQSPKQRYKSTQKSSNVSKRSNQTSYKSILQLSVPRITDDSGSYSQSVSRQINPNESALINKLDKSIILKAVLKKIMRSPPKESDTIISEEKKPMPRPFLNHYDSHVMSQESINQSSSHLITLNEMQRDQSNFVANFLSEKKEMPQVPGLKLHNKPLSVRDNTVYNRGVSVDKAKIISERNTPRGHVPRIMNRSTQIGN